MKKGIVWTLVAASGVVLLLVAGLSSGASGPAMVGAAGTANGSVAGAGTVALAAGGLAEALPVDAGRVETELVDVASLIPDLIVDMRYHGADNFVGRPVDGYLEPVCLLTPVAAAALADVQAALTPFGLGLKVFDCYRPTRAVADFARWARDLADVANKAAYYPDVPKEELFVRGYIAERSGHSRASTLDLTLVDRASGQELPMGTSFDWFGPESWPTSPAINGQARANRMLLQSVMQAHGFRPLAEEWWHFTLNHEPLPETYLDVPVVRP